MSRGSCCLRTSIFRAGWSPRSRAAIESGIPELAENGALETRTPLLRCGFCLIRVGLVQRVTQNCSGQHEFGKVHFHMKVAVVIIKAFPTCRAAAATRITEASSPGVLRHTCVYWGESRLFIHPSKSWVQSLDVSGARGSSSTTKITPLP